MTKNTWMIAVTVGCILAAGSARAAGGLNPTSAPAPTMRTLEEIYQKVAILDTNLISIVMVTNVFQSFGSGMPKTGQTNSYQVTDDGDLERGVAPPAPRFTDNGNGAVSDNMTGLIWLKDLNAFTNTWSNALVACATLNSGEHGLSDGSVEGNWRMPNVRELFSLLDFGRYAPALTAGHPFTNYVPAPFYWSSTTHGFFTDSALGVRLDGYNIESVPKFSSYPVLPVRGGP